MRALVARLAPVVIATLALMALVGVLGAATASASECPNEQVRGESNENPLTHEAYDASLSECRAYEMVSPVIKEGQPIQAPVGYVSPGVDGGAVGFMANFGRFAEPEGTELFTPYTSVRSASGWITHAQTPPASIIPNANANSRLLNAPDISRQVVCGNVAASRTSIFIATFACALHESAGAWRLATPVYTQVGTSTQSTYPSIIGASRDLSHIVFTLYSLNTVTHLLPEDTTQSVNGSSISALYEISGAGSSKVELKLVNVNNNGEVIGTGPPKLGNVLSEGTSPGGRSLHAVSEDGSTVFFEATPTGGVQTVYARVGGLSTVSISKPTVVDCTDCQTSFATQLPAEYQGASADGSKVFFTTEQELFAGHAGNNLYEYDFDAAVGQRVTLVSRGISNAAVQGVLTNSDDGSHVYFVAQGVLTSTTNGLGQHAIAGADNLYVFERDEAHPTGYIGFAAILCSGEHSSGTAVDPQCPSTSTDKLLWIVERENTADGRDQTTSGGRYLIFDTYALLAAEDINKAQAVYRYDSQTGELAWISHAVPGFTPANKGNAALIPPTTGGSNLMGAQPDISNRGRAINEDGQDVIFTTTEKLSQADTNEALDTYLWHDGTVSLVSDGIAPAPFTLNPENSSVMSESGGDIYFLTTGKLVGQDVDEIADMYDARIDGGFPVPKIVECASEASGQERGEACQGSPSGAPLFGAPASASFMGGTNLSSPGSSTSSGASKSTPQSKSKPPTRAQRLAAALKACRKVRARKKRVACEGRARKKYGGKAKLTSKVASKSGRGR